MSDNPFKVGDKVRLIKCPIHNLVVGQICTVDKTYGSHSFSVKELVLPQGYTNRLCLSPSCWELVTEPPEEAAKRLLEGLGYMVTPPPEPLKGMIVVWSITTVGADKCLHYSPYSTYQNWSPTQRTCRKLHAIVSWQEGTFDDGKALVP